LRRLCRAPSRTVGSQTGRRRDMDNHRVTRLGAATLCAGMTLLGMPPMAWALEARLEGASKGCGRQRPFYLDPAWTPSSTAAPGWRGRSAPDPGGDARLRLLRADHRAIASTTPTRRPYVDPGDRPRPAGHRRDPRVPAGRRCRRGPAVPGGHRRLSPGRGRPAGACPLRPAARPPGQPRPGARLLRLALHRPAHGGAPPCTRVRGSTWRWTAAPAIASASHLQRQPYRGSACSTCCPSRRATPTWPASWPATTSAWARPSGSARSACVPG
jgi:hypothetical protein